MAFLDSRIFGGKWTLNQRQNMYILKTKKTFLKVIVSSCNWTYFQFR